MKYYYKLKGFKGTYTSNNIFSLMLEVFKHRLQHLIKHGSGWINESFIMGRKISSNGLINLCR